MLYCGNLAQLTGSAVSEVLSSLIRPLQPDARALVRRRFNDMTRELKHLRSMPHLDYVIARKHGWNREALETVLALNSFYQEALAPLASSGRNYWNRELGSSTPIAYGKSMRFDRSWCETVTAAHDAFLTLSAELEIPPAYLTAPHTSDLLYRLGRDLHEHER